ncbi:hypothetical protein COMA1_11453 [Candidatus Nitrospira nitrosa]|uniref:Uncharacterized protein n=2 Tax=Candidatus Nitrospira nitrosa TaxID=1742972 RepID=A0A0S4LB11_9BACT|nr:hypothetical protein COMA1_11453 [Candidatus Nitrospira nitrosa]
MAERKTDRVRIGLLVVLVLWPAPDSIAGMTIRYDPQGVFDFTGTIERVLGRAESYLKATSAKDVDGNQLSVWKSELAALEYLQPRVQQNSDIELQTAVAVLAWGVSSQKGQQQMEQIIRANPSYATGHCLLAIFAMRERDLENYGRHFEEAIRADPNYLPAYNSLLLYYGHVGKRDSARELFARGNAQFPKDSSLLYNQGLNFLNDERWEEAQGSLQQAVSRQPSDQNRLILGSIQLRRQQYERAQTAFESILKANPKNIFALAGLAETYKERQNFATSISLMKQAIAIEPTNTDLQDELRVHEEAYRKYSRHKRSDP